MVVRDDTAELPEEVIQSSNLENATQKNENTRLMISHIENVNFKSYAGKQVLGPFHKSFSSIVGPNGSGKSNVIDAMLFVFGYRSKKIRSKKVSLLIHNSENHQNIDSCTVTVYFQKIIDLPGDDYEVIPNSKFTVSRTARKDGSSDYYMDGKKQTFKEIGTVLRASGIDLDHNRFLILQGEVEQISMMRPKAESEHDEGMLEYLEDIIGTNRLKEPIEQAAKEVEELNEKRGEKLNRAKAVEKEKDELEGVKNEALEYLTMENNITKKNHLLYQKYIYDCKEIETKSSDKCAEVKKQLDELEEKLKVFVEKKKESGKEYKKINKLFDKLVEEAEEKKRAFAEFEKIDLKLREDLKHRKQNQKKLDKNLNSEIKKLEELESVPEKSRSEIEKCTQSLEQLQKQKEIEEAALNEVMAGLKHETEGMQQEKDIKEQELLEKQKGVNEAKSKLDVATSELEVYMSRYNSYLTQYEQAKENVEKAKNQKEEKIRQLKETEDDIPSLQREIKNCQKELSQVITEEENVTSKVRTSRAKVEECRSAMHSNQSRSVVIEALMKEKERGKLKGIYGRLGDLGGIDNKYDIAISTACGPLDFVVCDSMDTAQKGVEFLKKNNVGSTTFIALDKVNVWKDRANSKIRTPENVKRLYDLVTVKNEAVKTAFYFALKDTLVADTLDQATRIAYPKDPKASRWRVVTLKGELIETSGTMSGGGNRPTKGRMGCRAVSESINPKQVEKLEQDLGANMEKLQELRKRKAILEDTIQKMTKQLSGLQHDYEKLEMEIKSLTVQESEQSERVKALHQQVKDSKPDPQHKLKLEKEIQAFEKTYKKVSDVTGKIENQVQTLHKKIMDIGRNKLSGQQAKVDSVNNIIDEVSQKKTKAGVALKTADRNLKKCAEKIETLEKEIEENKETIKNIEEVEIKKLEADAVIVLNEGNEGQEKMKEMQVKLEEVKKAFESTDHEEGEMKSKEIDLKHDFQKYETTMKENRNKITHWNNKLSSLSLHKIPRSYSSSEESTAMESAPAEDLISLTEDEVKSIDDNALAYEITVLTEKLGQSSPNMAALAEYYKKEEAYLSRVKELEEVTQERDNKRKQHEDLRKQRLDEFMAGFSIITSKLKEMYQMITLGGDAELELVDSLDPFSEGIVFSVRPPKKSWKNISNLSGGEKTLSSLALVFALHHYKPTPLYVMDEIDAALDFKNVSIVANYIKERTRNAQFIIISLRNNMFELADRLVGIYKTDNCTKSVVMNPTLIS